MQHNDVVAGHGYRMGRGLVGIIGIGKKERHERLSVPAGQKKWCLKFRDVHHAAVSIPGGLHSVSWHKIAAGACLGAGLHEAREVISGDDYKAAGKKGNSKVEKSTFPNPISMMRPKFFSPEICRKLTDFCEIAANRPLFGPRRFAGAANFLVGISKN